MKFSEIKGSEETRKKLIRTVVEQRVSHAQLFYGPENSLKLQLAIAYAQFINCTNRQGMPGNVSEYLQTADLPDSCGTCPSCVKYQKLAHPDLHFIYPVANSKKVTSKPQSKHYVEDWRKFLLETHFRGSLLDWYEAIGIENKQGLINATDCNEIITTLSYKSYESEYKVMIIWMVEKLFHSAAPKLLKILEEPPEKTLFLLIAEDPDQIIRTILSRTLLVRIPPASGLNPEVREEEILHFESFRQWMRDCYAGKAGELIKFSGEISRIGREKQKSFLHYALKMVGQCATMNYMARLPEQAEPEEKTFITNFAPFITAANLPRFNELLNEAIFHIERNAHAGTMFLDLSLKIVRLFKPGFYPPPK